MMPSAETRNSHGPGADVAGLAQDRLRRLHQLGVLRVGEERRGRLLDQLLVPALQRAVAGGDDDDRAVLVRQALRLDVPRTVEVPLDEALAAPERRDRLAGGGLEHLVDLARLAGDLQATAAAAERRLDGDGQAVLRDERVDLLDARAPGPACRRPAGAPARCAMWRALTLSPSASMADGRGTDPDQAGVDDGLREAGVLGEEAVAGVHGVGPGAPRDVEQLGDVEVRLGRAGAVQRERLVGDAHVQRLAVGVGVDGDGADPGVATGTGDADGDLTAVGDEDLGDSGHGSP